MKYHFNEMNRKERQAPLILLSYFLLFLLAFGIMSKYLVNTIVEVLNLNDYLSFFYESESLSILAYILIVILICLFLSLLDSEDSTSFNFRLNIDRNKILRYFITFVISISCLFFLLLHFYTLTTTIVRTNSVSSMNGKVDRVVTVSDKLTGDERKRITIVDNDGKKHDFTRFKQLESFEANKGDTVEIDYIPNREKSLKLTGDIVGYKSKS
ncbi:TPA_asm: hypothetical protein GZX72_14595 [Listeria monocytogenes]|nr:hypothetical protein [Listeria monocytogenes]